MQKNHGWSYILAILSLPYLLLARSGLFGPEAQAGATASVATEGAYVRLLVPLLAVVLLGIVIGWLILSVI